MGEGGVEGVERGEELDVRAHGGGDVGGVVDCDSLPL